MASLSETVRFQPLRTGSVAQEREYVLNGKDSDSDGSRRRDIVEPTPTREQTELGRRSPHMYGLHVDIDLWVNGQKLNVDARSYLSENKVEWPTYSLPNRPM